MRAMSVWTNGAAGAPVEGGDASTYTVAITPDGVGDLEIGVAADVATGRGGQRQHGGGVGAGGL